MRDPLRALVRLAAGIVPSARRREFRDEWEAELACAREASQPSRRGRLQLARRTLGVLPDAWCLFRQQWSLDMLVQDIRQALRLMRQRLGFTLVVVATLGLGVGANAAMFSIVNAVLLRPLPFAHPDRLLQVWENDRLNGKPQYPVAPANYADWQQQSRAFERLAAYVGTDGTLKTGDDVVGVSAAVVSYDFFDVLGARPLLGSGFTADMASPGHQRSLLLSYEAWQRYFAGDPRVVGRDIDIGAPKPYHVLGVMPRGFEYPSRGVAFWRVLVMDADTQALRAVHFLSLVGRLKPGVTLAQAQADMDAIAARQQHAYPETNSERGVTLVPLREQIVGEVRRPLYVVSAAVFLVLLIACANIANLMLVRAIARRRELAVRAALGADRFRLVRQLLVEGLLLAFAGGAAGLAIAFWVTAVLARVAAPYLPRISTVSVDLPVVIALSAIAIASGLFFGIAPAITASRADVRDALQDGARLAGGGRGSRRFRSALVVGELAVACTLVIGAGLVLRSFWAMMQVSPGFTADHLLTAAISLPDSRYPDGAHISAFYQSLEARVASVPMVAGVGLTNTLPMKGSGPTTWLTIEHRERPKGEPPEVNYRVATPGFFHTMQVPILAGRGLSPDDTATSLKTVVVNQTLVQRFFPEQDPVGARVRIGPNPKAAWRTIVGVVGDMHQNGPEMPAVPELYLPATQDDFSSMAIVVRTNADPTALASTLRSIVRSIDPQLPVVDLQSMESIVGEHVASRRLLMILLGTFAALALGLALVGIYGVMAYLVSQRTREIGVRMALGADRPRILRAVLADGGKLAAVGLAAGIALSLLGTQALRSVLFDVSSTDPTTFAVVAGGMLAVAVLACAIPAYRAAHVDPLTAIRVE
jgi:putative ABC transport system permease protein